MPERYCGYCGTTLPAEAQFCGQCGKTVRRPPSVAGSDPKAALGPAAVPSPIPAASPPPAQSPTPAPPPATVATAPEVPAGQAEPVASSGLVPAKRPGWWGRRSDLQKIGVAVGVLVVAAVAAVLGVTLPSGGDESTSGASSSTRAYAVGDTGPGGGLVFYDKGDDGGGWRYLEAAPASTEWERAEWGLGGVAVSGAGGIVTGTGVQNTAALVASQGPGDVYAAQLCDDLTCGGFSDWFLPSKDELDLMYKNLASQGLGDFQAGYYWSSTESDADYAWSRSFSGEKPSVYLKGAPYRVRAIRAFSWSGSPEAPVDSTAKATLVRRSPR